MSTTIERTNRFEINGTLKDATVKEGRSKKTGSAFVTADLIMTSVINGVENEFTISFIANELDANKKPNRMYSALLHVKENVGTKLKVIGRIEENRYWSKKNSAIASYKRLRGSFFNKNTEDADSATFELGGFIVKEASERRNKENQIYKYTIDLGQADYKGTSLSVFTLDIDPNHADVVHGVASYKMKDTVVFNGSLNFLVTKKEVEDTNSAFGQPIVRVYTNRTSNFFITGGSKPIVEEGRKYTDDIINDLVSDYKAKAEEITFNAKSSVEETPEEEIPTSPSPAASTIPARQTSLL